MSLAHDLSTASAYNFARFGRVYTAYAAGITALQAYTATTLTGPILWNGNTTDAPSKAILLGVSISVTTASAAAVAVGIAGGIGQSAAPTSTSAATLVSSTYVTGAQPKCTFYNTGTVTNAPGFFLPLYEVGTTALTAESLSNIYIPIDGMIIVPPKSYICLAASATATTSVLQVGFVWAEASV